MTCLLNIWCFAYSGLFCIVSQKGLALQKHEDLASSSRPCHCGCAFPAANQGRTAEEEWFNSFVSSFCELVVGKVKFLRKQLITSSQEDFCFERLTANPSTMMESLSCIFLPSCIPTFLNCAKQWDEQISPRQVKKKRKTAHRTHHKPTKRTPRFWKRLHVPPTVVPQVRRRRSLNHCSDITAAPQAFDAKKIQGPTNGILWRRSIKIPMEQVKRSSSENMTKRDISNRFPRVWRSQRILLRRVHRMSLSHKSSSPTWTCQPVNLLLPTCTIFRRRNRLVARNHGI